MLIKNMVRAMPEAKEKKPKVDPQLAAAQIIADDPQRYEGVMLLTALMRLEREKKEQQSK